MKIYAYNNPAECGFITWPVGEWKLEGECVTDPNEADVFMCPGTLAMFPNPGDLDKLPFYRGREARHVFGSIDESLTIYDSPAMFFRCNLKTWMHSRDVNSVAWPWPVDDYADCIEPPETGFKYDVSFHGWLIGPTRPNATESCLAMPSLNCDMVRYDTFTGQYLNRNPDGSWANPEGVRRMNLYKQSMRESRVCLCPESIPGDFPYRFFEAMSAGRVPIMVGSDQVFPFADEVPYDEFCLRVTRQNAAATGTLIRALLDGLSDDELHRRGKLARFYWEKYLDHRKWTSLMTYVVEKQLTRLQQDLPA